MLKRAMTLLVSILLLSPLSAAPVDDVKKARDNLFRALKDLDDAGIRVAAGQLIQCSSEEAADALGAHVSR